MPCSARLSAFDAEFGPVAIPLGALLRQVVVHVGKHGVIDLQHDTRLVNFKILFAQRIRDGEDVILFALVVLVGGIVTDAGRRHGGEEHVFDLGGRGGSFQIIEIAAHIGVAFVFDRSHAGVPRRADRRRVEIPPP